jgi:hypothetical protein
VRERGGRNYKGKIFGKFFLYAFMEMETCKKTT